jgi:hypothetical protein
VNADTRQWPDCARYNNPLLLVLFYTDAASTLPAPPRAINNDILSQCAAEQRKHMDLICTSSAPASMQKISSAQASTPKLCATRPSES